MNHINAVNTTGGTVKVYPKNVKGINKSAFLEKFTQHLAFPGDVYDQCQDAYKKEADEKAEEARIEAVKKADQKKAEEKKA